MTIEKGYLTPKDVADTLGITTTDLAMLRESRRGHALPFTKTSSLGVRYAVDDVQAYKKSPAYENDLKTIMQNACIAGGNITEKRFSNFSRSNLASNISEMSENLKPYAMFTISTNSTGIYKDLINREHIEKSLRRDVENLFFRYDHIFWDTPYVTREVAFSDRFHAIVFLEKLETHPHAHILLYLHPDKSFSDVLAKNKEVDRRIHFLVVQFQILANVKCLQLCETFSKYEAYPKVKEWYPKKVCTTIKGEPVWVKRDAFRCILPGGEFYVSRVESGAGSAAKLAGYCTKETPAALSSRSDAYFLLSQSMSSRQYLGPTNLPLLGGE